MSIGDILPSILSECGIDNSSPAIDDASFEMRQISGLMNMAGNDIATRAEWSNGVRELSVPMETLSLPNDFQKMASGGAVAVDDPDYQPVRPVLSESTWQLLGKHMSAQPFYHLTNGELQFLPVDALKTVKIKYISSSWLKSRADRITANTDETIFPERLLERGTIWRWKRQKGLPFDDLMAEFEADLVAAIKADRGSK